MASDAPRPRFEAVTQAMWRQLEEQPSLLDSPANRITLRNALLEAIAPLGEAGAFRPDRSTVGRHNKIVMRLERAIEEAGDQPLDMVDLCRQVGASRRSLEAIVRQRTGKSPWEYLRWRRLWRARAMLRRPAGATTVTDVAFNLGFWHLSRFAAAYMLIFGERPSVTLARANGSSTH